MYFVQIKSNHSPEPALKKNTYWISIVDANGPALHLDISRHNDGPILIHMRDFANIT